MGVRGGRPAGYYQSHRDTTQLTNLGAGLSRGKNREKDYVLPPTTVSLTFFDDHEGDVIGLWHALSKLRNVIQELLLERVTSRGCLLPNEL